MSDQCGRCKDPVGSEGDLDCALCSVCSSKYHFTCDTVGENSWRTMGNSRRGAWKCSICRNQAAKKGTNTVDVVQSSASCGDDNVASMIRELGNRFSVMESNVTARLVEFEDSLNFFSRSMDEMTVSIKNIEKKYIVLEKKLGSQEAENKELKSKMKNLEAMLHQRDQKDLGNKMEISGLKDTAVNEIQFVQKVIELSGLKDENIQFKVEKIIRQPKENQSGNNSQTLIVQFKSEDTRSIVLSKIKELLHINLNSIRPKWDLLCVELKSVLEHLDVLVLTEIKVNEEEALAFQLRGYHQISRCRVKNKGGGVMVFCRDSIKIENLDYNFDEADSLVLKLIDVKRNRPERKCSMAVQRVHV
ncbi:hypothetical protein M8J75_009252 [Diaphorina citri]|nr:hypothetical protein M8J75_009252 [Diaphorina citri]